MMTSVSGISPIFYNLPSESLQTRAGSKAEVHVDGSSEVNRKLLKALIVCLADTGGSDKMNDLVALLKKHGLDSNAANVDHSRLSSALAQLKRANEQAQAPKETVKTVEEAAKMIANQQRQVKECTRAVVELGQALAAARMKSNYSASGVGAAKEKALLGAVLTEDNSQKDIDTNSSYAELWAVIAEAIQSIKSDYVDFYAELMKKYTELYEAFNKYVQNAAGGAVSSGKDGNTVNFDAQKMADGYKKFKEELAKIDLGSVKGWDAMSEEQKQAMITTLAPAFKVDSSGKISFDLDQYEATSKYPSGFIPDGEGVFPSFGEISTASYQAWLASFNAVGTALQSNMQAFAQRYSQANSTFDNLNKVLSGTISSLADSAKEVLKSLS